MSISAAAGSAVGGGIDIMGALGMFNPPTPDQPQFNLAQGLAPSATATTIAADEELDPALAASQQQIEYNNLFGSSGSSYVINGKRYNSPGGPGTLAMMEQAQPALTKLGTDQQTALRGADIADMGKYSPDFYAMMGNYNPAATGLMSTLDNQAQQQLDTNGGLTAAEQHQLQQQIRGSQAARGMGEGSGSAADEAYYMFNNQQALRQQNQAFAGNVLGQEQNLYGNPTQILGMPNANVPNLNFSAPTSTVTPNSTDELDQLFNMNYQANLAQQAGAWQTQQKYLSGLTSGGGGSGGGSGGGGGGGGSMGSMAGMAAMFL